MTQEKIVLNNLKSTSISKIELSVLFEPKTNEIRDEQSLIRGERLTFWFMDGKGIEYWTYESRLIGNLFNQILNLDSNQSIGKFYDKYIKKNMIRLNFKRVG